LAQNLVDIGSMMGKDVTALITDMDQPLGFAIGKYIRSTGIA
jgi:thymidine phosphorylase